VSGPAARRIIYFDHAATSWPKPQPVMDAVVRAMTEAGGNPGRGAHTLALAAARTVLEARSSVARLLGVPDSRDVIFTPGCTYALNLALKGLLKRGDRVVVSSMEHNACVRPLAWLQTAGVKLAVVQADAEGRVDPDAVERAVMAAPTAAVVCQHASNVTGTIQPVGDFADIAHAAGALMIVDGAQGGGHLELDLPALGADVYAIPGHKGLLGPQGSGVLYLAPGVEPRELIQGGSGGSSGKAEMPKERPDRYEAGTAATPALAGLGAGAAFLLERGDSLRAEERRLTRLLIEGLAGIEKMTVLGPPPAEERVPVVSVTHAHVPADRVAFELDQRYGIAVRAGHHCAPWAHQSVGTGETGAVRFSIGWGLAEDDVAEAIAATAEVCA
jgi:cysteine desulfurase family protein